MSKKAVLKLEKYPEGFASVPAILKEIRGYSLKVEQMHIEDEKAFEVAKKFGKTITDTRKLFENARLEIVRSYDAQKKEATSFLAEKVKELDGLISVVNKAVATYQKKLIELRRQEAELERSRVIEAARLRLAESLEKAEESGKQSDVNKITAAANKLEKVENQAVKIVTKSEGVVTTNLKTKYFAVIVYPDLVPHEYCSPDEKKLNKFASTFEGEPPAVKGVRWMSKDNVSYK